MNTALAAAGPSADAAESRRALVLDLTLKRSYLVGSAVFMVIVAVLALTQVARLGFIPIAWAVTAPWVLSRGDRAQDATVRAQVGVSRAARVRARTRLVVLLQLAFIVLAAFVLLVGPQPDQDAAMRHLVPLGGPDVWAPTAVFVVDLACWIPAILWSHVWAGADSLRRPGAGWLSAVGAYAGMYLLISVGAVLAGSGAQFLLDGGGSASLTGVGYAVILAAGALAAVLAVLALRWRAGIWAREA